MRTLFFAPYACAVGHHEADLELVLTHHSQGDEVHVIQCRSEIPICDQNHEHQRMTCLKCTSISSVSFRRVGIPAEQMHRLVRGPAVPPPAIPVFADIEALKTFEWQGIPGIGLSVASSLITHVHDINPDTKLHAGYISKMLHSFMIVYENIQRHLEAVKPDRFYVFNARTAPTHAAFQAARRMNVETMVIDRDNVNEYLLLLNHVSTDFAFTKKQGWNMLERLRKDPDGEAVAREWFEQNRGGNAVIISNYLAMQKQGKLPAGFDSKKRNIAFFGSSEWELGLCPGMENLFYPSHQAAIEHMATSLADSNFHIYFRAHPHLSKYPNSSQSKALATLSFPNVTIIPSTADVDSYALLEACEKTVALNSTLSIEAVYWGKPSILCGRASFEEFPGACHVPKTRDEVVSLLRQTLPAPDPRAALPYGYWMKRRGLPLRFVTPNNPRKGQAAMFLGQPITCSLTVRLLTRLTHEWRVFSANFLRLFALKLRKDPRG